MRKLFTLFLTALTCASMTAAQFNGLKSLTTGGKSRQYFLYVPDNLPANQPLIISCHGMNQDYNYQKEQTRWPAIADTAMFVVAYPVGIAGTVWGQPFETGWNLDDMTDVNFMLDLVAAVQAEYHIDPTRVYMSGFSLGGAFVYYVANKAANAFAAFAPISGYNLMVNNTSTTRPVPIVHVHGTSDNVMAYSGVKNYLKKWAQAQNCNMTPEEYAAASYASTRYTGGDCEVEVVLYSVNGRGHEPSNYSFHTSNAIWAFCRQYSTACGKISTQAIETVESEDAKAKSQKLIRDGMLLIERNDKTYNAQGAQVK